MRKTLIIVSFFLGSSLLAISQPAKFVIDTINTSTRHMPQSRGGGVQWWPYPVIFIHGLGGDWYSWGELGDMFYDAGYSYGGQLEYCLNADANNYYVPQTGELLTFVPQGLPAADFYDINFDCNPNGNCFSEDLDGIENSVLSNQAAIVKQGIALGHAINAVLQATGRNKVILMGHSMGGLCAREYLQNDYYWPDGNHHVAKLITAGTPHGGSNATFVNFIPGVDEQSEAVRDLREDYFESGYVGAYLYGSVEDDFYISNSLLWDYYNVDVNCNGVEGNSITGLNEKSIYTDLDFAIIKSDFNWLLNGGDGVVDDYNADLVNYYPGLPDYEKFWCSDLNNNGHSDYSHTTIPNDIWTDMEALDEPDDYHLSYEIETNTPYYGTITLQGIHANYSNDYDDYIVDIPQNGVLNVQVAELESNWGVAVYDYANGTYLGTQLSNGSSVTNLSNISVVAGQYIIEVFGAPYFESWVQPYFFQVDFFPSGPTSVDEKESTFANVYPNPSTGIFNLNAVSTEFEINVFNLQGQLQSSFPPSNRIDLTGLSNGTYIVQYMNSDDQPVNARVVVAH